MLNRQFRDETSRDAYEQALTERMLHALRTDRDFAVEAIVMGRVGLAELTDAQLIQLGADAWGIQPELEATAIVH